MTTNQLILLLDCYRGFTPEAHHGTVNADARFLTRSGLIDTKMNTTAEGCRIVDALLASVPAMVLPKKDQLHALEARFQRMSNEHAREEIAMRKEIDRIIKEVVDG